MPGEPDKPSSNPAQKAGNQEHSLPTLPPSKPLQIFLLFALLVSGTAYVVDQYTERTTEETLSNKGPTRLRRLVENQSRYLTNTDLGQQAEAKKRYSDAVGYYRLALIGQDTAQGHLNLGNALLKEGNPDMAFAQYQEAIRQQPGLEVAYVAWGRALRHQGRTDDAVQVYRDALRHDTNFAQVHYEFALALKQQRETAAAEQLAAEKTSDTAAASQAANEAELFASDAVKQFQAAEKSGLDTAEFWCDYGTLLNQLKKYPDAEVCLSKAVAEEPTMGAAQYQLAVAGDRQGKYADAIGHYEGTLAVIPDDPATLNALALLYTTATNEQVRSPKMAVLLATRACEATINQNARYLDTLARAYAADGDFFQAITWEDKAVRRATQLGDRELLRELQPRFSLYVQHKAG
jgi:tetratricopeptide (TPR) repeat protein